MGSYSEGGGEIIAEPDEIDPGYGILNALAIIPEFVAANGWLILGLVLVLYYFKDRILSYWDSFKDLSANAADNVVSSVMDPENLIARQEAMEAARQRMQEAYSAKAAEFAVKQKEKEEVKRQEKLQDWEKHEKGLGYRSKVKPKEELAPQSTLKPKTAKPKLKPEYNPLMGDGTSGACFRPSRRGGAAGG